MGVDPASVVGVVDPPAGVPGDPAPGELVEPLPEPTLVPVGVAGLVAPWEELPALLPEPAVLLGEVAGGLGLLPVPEGAPAKISF